MNKPNDHDWLDKTLSSNIFHIDDNGFTDAVMQCLPAQKYANRQWQTTRMLIIGCAVVFSILLFFLSLPEPLSLFTKFVEQLYSLPFIALAALAITLYIATSIVTYWLVHTD